MAYGWPGVPDAPQKASKRLPNQFLLTNTLVCSCCLAKEHLCCPERNPAKQTNICFAPAKEQNNDAI